MTLAANQSDAPAVLLAGLRRQAEDMMRARGITTLPDAPDLPYFTGYDCGRLYGWDQYFEGIVQLHMRWPATYLRNSLKLFLNAIDRDGYIPRTLPRIWWGEFHAQPFLAQQAVLLLRMGDDLSWMQWQAFYALKHYLLHWLNKRDVRGQGLSVWDHAGHTGMDNHVERAGDFHDAYCEGVDLNAYLVRECEAFSVVADHLGRSRTATAMRQAAERRREAINRWCWDEQAGTYFDYHAVEHRPIPVKHGGVFAALWAGVPSPAQAQRLIEGQLLNEREFARLWPVPALAASEAGYVAGRLPDEEYPDCCPWRAHTWMPVNYMTIRGLVRYGYREHALRLARRTAEMFCRHPFREYYETGQPCGRDPFWGWSNLALFVEEEVAAGADPTELSSASQRKPHHVRS